MAIRPRFHVLIQSKFIQKAYQSLRSTIDSEKCVAVVDNIETFRGCGAIKREISVVAIHVRNPQVKHDHARAYFWRFRIDFCGVDGGHILPS